MTLTSTFRSRVKRAAVTSLAGTILLGGVGLGVQQASATTSGSPAVFANDQKPLRAKRKRRAIRRVLRLRVKLPSETAGPAMDRSLWDPSSGKRSK